MSISETGGLYHFLRTDNHLRSI